MNAFETGQLVLAIPVAVVAILRLRDRYDPMTKQQGDSSGSKQSANAPKFKLRMLQRPEPDERLLSRLNAMLLLTALPILLFDVYAVYYMAIHGLAGMDFGSMILTVLFFGLPIYVMFDVFISQPRKRKRGTSSVAASATFELEGDGDALLDTCHQALIEMGGKLNRLDGHRRMLKVEFEKDFMTVHIQRTRSRKWRVSALSDSRLITVIFDGGRNRSRLDTFIKKICN